MKSCLDTTFLVDVMRKRPGAVSLASRLDDEPLAPAISAIVQAEFLEGALHAGGPYLERVRDLMADLQLLDVTPQIAGEAARLGSLLLTSGKRVDILDLLIGATAKLENAVLITRDTDQLRIPGIMTETYTV